MFIFALYCYSGWPNFVCCCAPIVTHTCVSAHVQRDVDAVNDIKDEIDEHMEMTNEINEAIAGPLVDMDEVHDD